MIMTEEKLEMERQINALKERKRGITGSIMALQTELASINGRCKTRLPNHEFQKLQSRRSEVIDTKQRLEMQAGEIQSEIARISIEKMKPSAAPPKADSDVVSQLVAMRDYYQNFSADATRVSSTRIMAAEFVGKLNPIIRGIVNAPQ